MKSQSMSENLSKHFDQTSDRMQKAAQVVILYFLTFQYIVHSFHFHFHFFEL